MSQHCQPCYFLYTATNSLFYFQDSSGRKFYYNGKTREKSWKPPRIRNRGTSEGYSAPTSPDPSGADSAFEMSPGVSESESRSAEEERMLVLPPPILMLDGENGGDMDTQSPTSKEVLEETSSTELLLDETGTYIQYLKTY